MLYDVLLTTESLETVQESSPNGWSLPMKHKSKAQNSDSPPVHPASRECRHLPPEVTHMNLEQTSSHPVKEDTHDITNIRNTAQV